MTSDFASSAAVPVIPLDLSALPDAVFDKLTNAKPPYGLNRLLQAALTSHACGTWSSLVSALYTAKWPLADLQSNIAFISRHFAYLQAGDKLDPFAIYSLLRAAGVQNIVYDPLADELRQFTDRECVLRNADYLSRLYYRGELLTGDLERDLQAHVFIGLDHAAVRGVLEPVRLNGRKLDLPQLTAVCAGYQLHLPGYVHSKLIEVTSDAFDRLNLVDGKTPEQTLYATVDYWEIKLLRAKSSSDAQLLAAVRKSLAEARSALETFRAGARLVETAKTTVKAKTVAPRVRHSADSGPSATALTQELHRVTGLILAGLQARVLGWPEGVVVGWLLRRFAGELVAEPPSSLIMSSVAAMVPHGLKPLCTKPALQGVFRWQPVTWGNTIPSAVDLKPLDERRVTKLINALVQDLPLLESARKYAANNVAGLVVDDEAVAVAPSFETVLKLPPVEAAKLVEPPPPPPTPLKLPVVKRPVAKPTVTLKPPKPPPVKVVKLVEPSLPPPPVVALVLERVAEEPMRKVKGTPMMAEVHRTAGLLMAGLVERGWPAGLILTSALERLVKLASPNAPYPAVVVNGLMGHGFTNLFSLRGSPSIYRREVVLVEVDEAENKVTLHYATPSELAEVLAVVLAGLADDLAYVTRRCRALLPSAPPAPTTPLVEEVVAAEPVPEPEAEPEFVEPQSEPSLPSEPLVLVVDEVVEVLAMPVEDEPVNEPEPEPEPELAPVADPAPVTPTPEEVAMNEPVVESTSPVAQPVSRKADFHRLLPAVILEYEDEMAVRATARASALAEVRGKREELARLEAEQAVLLASHEADDQLAEQQLTAMRKLLALKV